MIGVLGHSHFLKHQCFLSVFKANFDPNRKYGFLGDVGIPAYLVTDITQLPCTCFESQ